MDYYLQPLISVFLAVGGTGFLYSVGLENCNIAPFETDGFLHDGLLEERIGSHPQAEPGRLDVFCRPPGTEQHGTVARPSDFHRPVAHIQHAIDHADEGAPVDGSHQRLMRLAQELRRRTVNLAERLK